MRRTLQHPARIVPLAFLAAIAVGTAAADAAGLPRRPGHARRSLTALFTATSAICVTGLVVVDTPTYWSGFGQVVILRADPDRRLRHHDAGHAARPARVAPAGAAQPADRPGARPAPLALGDVRRVLAPGRGRPCWPARRSIAVVLTVRFWLGYDYPFGKAALARRLPRRLGVQQRRLRALHRQPDRASSATGGSACRSRSAVIVGGIGFPVLFELRRELRRPAGWSTHTRITVLRHRRAAASSASSRCWRFEWSNPRTLGPLGVGRQDARRVLPAVRSRVRPASTPSTTRDANRRPSRVTNGLMFIGGGSASTAGGIKVTTFFLLAFVIWAEVRGERGRGGRPPPDRRGDAAAGARRSRCSAWRWSPSARWR